MRSRAELANGLFALARNTFNANVRSVTQGEALAAAGGYRSVLGLAKHATAWSHVYHSYAFDEQPRHWIAIDWPRGLRDTIDPSKDYVDEIVAWANSSFDAWNASLKELPDEEFDVQHRCHWGATMPLFDIVGILVNHWAFHTGELNAVVSIVRGEAWEYTEEVEENHISTAGHRVRGNWMSDAQVAGYEAHMEKRDADLRSH